MLYYCKISENTYITHDGYIQLGIIHDLEYFKKNVKVEYCETHWCPDTFDKRYKRVNFQKHLQHQGQLPKDLNVE
jgi:hypothetical protein